MKGTITKYLDRIIPETVELGSDKVLGQHELPLGHRHRNSKQKRKTHEPQQIKFHTVLSWSFVKKW
jgi:hypothetical protein